MTKLAVFLALCLAVSASWAQTIKIGLVTALSGQSARAGEAITRGLSVAIDEINAKGGVLGRKLELVRRDDEATPAKGVIAARLNVLVSGGTGAGKTTLLNVLSSFIAGHERVVTIEDAAELTLRQRHVVRLETRPPNIEGKGAVRQRQLVINALRMRPDRIIVGEVRGEEALDMLQAMNTGHDGSMTTIHSNSPRDTLRRIETMVLMAGVDLPQRAIREQMASAIDLIVHQTRLKDGTRRITHITEVNGMEGEVITLQDLFLFDFHAGLDEQGRFRGTLRSTGLRPGFLDRLADRAIYLPPRMFGLEEVAR